MQQRHATCLCASCQQSLEHKRQPEGHAVETAESASTCKHMDNLLTRWQAFFLFSVSCRSGCPIAASHSSGAKPPQILKSICGFGLFHRMLERLGPKDTSCLREGTRGAALRQQVSEPVLLVQSCNSSCTVSYALVTRAARHVSQVRWPSSAVIPRHVQTWPRPPSLQPPKYTEGPR